MKNIGFLETIINLTLSSFEIQLTTLDLLGHHPARNQLLETVKKMAEYLLKQVAEIENMIDETIKTQSEEMMHASAFARDTLIAAEKRIQDEPMLREIADAMTKGHENLVKELGKEETQVINDLSASFKTIKSRTQTILRKIENLNRVT